MAGVFNEIVRRVMEDQRQPNDPPVNRSDEALRAEKARLAALRSSELLDSVPEESFDRLTRLATKALGVPVALISLVDDRRQFFKSQQGLPSPYRETRETPLSHSFCQLVARTGNALVVADARLEPLVADNLAIPDLGVIAYAGVPLTDMAGNCFGSLCAIDSRPRHWTPDELEILKGLAANVMSEIAGRTRERGLQKDLSDMRQLDAERKAISRLTVHDLRTPLNSLLLNLEVLSALDLDADQSEWANLAQRSALALSDLVGDLIDNEVISQRGPGALSLSRCPPLAMVEAALRQVRGASHIAQLQMSATSEADIPDIEVDERKMIRVLVNLLGNAVKFTPTEGSVHVQIGRKDQNRIQIAVTDSGIGFDQSNAEEIFKTGVMLNPSAPSRHSTGWGLEFCKKTVAAHGGSIEVQSAVGRGSSFTVVLPVKQASHVS